jgi:hypothetical protein
MFERKGELRMATNEVRSCWQNCAGSDENSLLSDREIVTIDGMEDSVAPLDDFAVRIRQLITGFEACYHEADKEAQYIIRAIGAGRCPPRSSERPPQRKRELENARHVLSTWCDNPAAKGIDCELGGVRADTLLNLIGEPSPLKVWQVQRVVDRVSHALDPNHPYYNLALSMGDYGEPGACAAGDHYSGEASFLQRTRETLIHDTVDGRASKVSLAFAIDLLMPCGWDFAGSLVTILKTVGGDVHADRPLACCARNLRLSPLCPRLRTISNTLMLFWRGSTPADNTDDRILASLGTPTPVKHWLAASLDKTIRLHLDQPFSMDLFT